MSANRQSRAEKAERLRRLMASEGATVSKNVQHFNRERYDAVAELDDWESTKTWARRIKEDAIERLPELIETVTAAVEANGGSVYVADDAADANRYVQAVCEDADAEVVVKSKSMTSEELNVNDAMAEIGCDVYETDLGELVLQLADDVPSHLVGPSLHKSRKEIAALFSDYFDLEEPLETAEELTNFARDYLVEKYREADVGMTGANFVVAETGSIVLVTNEGNARKAFEATNTHIAIAGIEKLVPSLSDLEPFLELLARSGTGQSLTAYTTIISPPVATPPYPFDGASTGSRVDGADPDAGTGDANRDSGTAGEGPDALVDGAGPDALIDGAGPDALVDGTTGGETAGVETAGAGTGDAAERDFHLVLVDNGRREMREDDVLRETLYCIRCGACANSCANFQHVGGHAFGGETYTGGIATGWEAGVHGLDSAATFNDLCTGCTRCVSQCPVKIDIAWINTAVRDRVNRGADPGTFDFLYPTLAPDEEPSGLSLQKRFFGNFATVAKFGSATAPVSNWLAERQVSRLVLDRVLGIDPRRELPRFRRHTLRDWFETRDGRAPSDPVRRAVVFPDLYTNYVQVERGKATIRTLEALGVAVELARIEASGRAPMSQGMVATAGAHAEAVADELVPAIEAGRDVVVIEPSDHAMFRDDYRRLLPADDFRTLAENSYEVMEYVYGLLEGEGVDPSPLAEGTEELIYHSHCQQRTLGLEAHTLAVLEDRGYDVVTTDAECCGMAGSFGYKSEYYELAMDVGRDLRHQIEDAHEGRRPVASGTSCTDQIEALIDEEPAHPIELIAPR